MWYLQPSIQAVHCNTSHYQEFFNNHTCCSLYINLQTKNNSSTQSRYVEGE
jgi:hypothetical protein